MANPDPYKARAAKKRQTIQQAGNITGLRLKLWQAVRSAHEIVSDEGADPALRLKAVHAITQAAASYTKLVEATEFEARLKDLEEKAGLSGR